MEEEKYYNEDEEYDEDEYLRPIIQTCCEGFMLSELLAYEDTREGK